MNRLLLPICLSLSVALLAACAAAAAGDRGERRDTISISGIEGQEFIFIDRYSIRSSGEYRVEATPADVWAALPGAYHMLGIPATELDRAAMRVGNPGFAVTRRLGEERVTRYIRCVTDAFGRSAADGDRIIVRIFTTVEEDDGEGATIRTDFSAVPQGSATSSAQTPCTSNGLLERAIERAVQLQLAL